VRRTRRANGLSSIGNKDLADLAEEGSTMSSLLSIKSEIEAKLSELDSIFQNVQAMKPIDVATIIGGFEDTMSNATAASIIL
jgi:hypothetical protein